MGALKTNCHSIQPCFLRRNETFVLQRRPVLPHCGIDLPFSNTLNAELCWLRRELLGPSAHTISCLILAVHWSRSRICVPLPLKSVNSVRIRAPPQCQEACSSTVREHTAERWFSKGALSFYGHLHHGLPGAAHGLPNQSLQNEQSCCDLSPRRKGFNHSEGVGGKFIEHVPQAQKVGRAGG